MGFKSDREFLRNISIGAIGTRKVAELLNNGGFRIIELERYSCSNKIWATKIKRVRVPDLLCLKTGLRIESRAKSDLKLTMSHAVNNPDRAWNNGLRKQDLVAFIYCAPTGDSFVASDRVNLFRVADLQETETRAGMSLRKAASEGSESRLTWPSTVPGKAGEVVSVTQESISTNLGGRTQKYSLARKDADGNEFLMTPYVKAGDKFGEKDTVIASAVKRIGEVACPDVPQYDFVQDLTSKSPVTVYSAVKALGYLPKVASRIKPRLVEITRSHADDFIRLEAAATLMRLKVQAGYDTVRAFAEDVTKPNDFRMEIALVLSEVRTDRSKAILKTLADDDTNDSELRAASAWGLSMIVDDLESSDLVPLMRDADELVAVHAIAGVTRLLSSSTIAMALDDLGDDSRLSAGVARALLAATKIELAPAIIARLPRAKGENREWLIYLLARLGRESVAPHLVDNGDIRSELEFFWKRHEENWTNRLDVADQIDFLLRQILN